MPSLFNTTVAANYGRMTPQQGYGSGQIYSQFGTRQYRFIKVTAIDDSVAIDFTDASYTANSKFSVAVRAIQTVAEVNMVFAPGTAGFIAVITDDTHNGAEVGSNVQATTFGILEAAIVAALKVSAANGGPGLSGTITAAVVAVDVDATGIALA
jgi:hypothetical protein